MIIALHTGDGTIVQVVVGSPAAVMACAGGAGLDFAEWTGSGDAAVVDALDLTHRVVGGVIVEKEG